MNRQIVRMFALVVVLFGTLVGFTSYWAVFDADNLQGKSANRRQLLEQALIPRGLIVASDGQTLADNTQRRSGAQTFYSRTYPTGDLFSHAVGYNFIDLGRSGLEQRYNEDLTGQHDEFSGLLDDLRGRRPEGNDLTTALDPKAQRVAYEGLAGRAGAVVALDSRSGAVRVMASVPRYDPNGLADRFSVLSRREGSPLVNRVTQSQYPPGSVFKVVTAAAALDSGKLTPESTVDGSSPQVFATKPLRNFGGKSFGQIPLTEALVNSVNTAFANVAVSVGKETMYKYMKRFGLNRQPPIDLPPEELATSGVYRDKKLLDQGDVIDVGRVGIGQGGVLVTPLQMAMVVQAVANRGELLEPYLVQKVSDRDGQVRRQRRPRKFARVMKPASADTLKKMMVQVVQRGTGTSGQIPGAQVAGKTGTAQIDVERGLTQAWFLAIAPAGDPRYVVAVTVERTTGQSGTGGAVAAPIAKQVLEALL